MSSGSGKKGEGGGGGGGGVLFATDVAARGLDFAGVDWVIQVDCPESVDSYVHRVGRTARAGKEGKALMFLDPSEEKFIEVLKGRGVVVGKVKIKEGMNGEGAGVGGYGGGGRGRGGEGVKGVMQRMAWEEPEMKYLAQRVGLFSSNLLP